MIKLKYLAQRSSNKMRKIIFILYFLTLCSSVYADSKMDLGLDVYNNKAECGACHTLQAAGSEGQIGPDLDALMPQMDKIIAVVTNGIGVMQAWEGILSRKEIEAVAYYVFQSTNK